MPDTIGVRLLGRSGLRVSTMCLGTMTFGTTFGWGAEESVCREIYQAFRQAGGNFLDTADVYTDGESETILGRLVAGERDAVVLGTKYTLPTAKGDPNSGGSHRKSLRRSVEASLRRIGTDYLDVLWVHARDEGTPIEDTLRALDDLVRAGTVLAIGVSNTPAWVVARADAIAELRGWTAFCGLQIEYSLAARSPERELLPMARELGLAVTAWSPLAGGLLSGKYSGPDAQQTSSRSGAPANLSPPLRRAVDVAADVAAELGSTTARVALAWVLRHGLIPVLGARTISQIRDNLGAAELQLDDAQLDRLDGAARVRLGYPHEFLRERRTLISGGVLNDQQRDS